MIERIENWAVNCPAWQLAAFIVALGVLGIVVIWALAAGLGS